MSKTKPLTLCLPDAQAAALRNGATMVCVPVKELIGATGVKSVYHRPDGQFVGCHLGGHAGVAVMEPFVAPFRPGEVVGVREAYTLDHADFYPHFPLVFRADGDCNYERNKAGEVYSPEAKRWYPFRWRAARTLPAHCIRTHFKVLGVACKLAKDVTEDEAEAMNLEAETKQGHRSSRHNFNVLWDRMYPRHPFADSWVWAAGVEVL